MNRRFCLECPPLQSCRLHWFLRPVLLPLSSQFLLRWCPLRLDSIIWASHVRRAIAAWTLRRRPVRPAWRTCRRLPPLLVQRVANRSRPQVNWALRARTRRRVRPTALSSGRCRVALCRAGLPSRRLAEAAAVHSYAGCTGALQRGSAFWWHFQVLSRARISQSHRTLFRPSPPRRSRRSHAKPAIWTAFKQCSRTPQTSFFCVSLSKRLPTTSSFSTIRYHLEF